jgi:shikimate kinase
MTPTPLQQLIVITGPVGAGKSTTALALADALRRPDLAVAVIDMDQLYGFVRQQDGYGDALAWMRARQGAAALANTWLGSGVPVVIVEGEFFNAQELSSMYDALQSEIVRSFFTLRLSYQRALERVQGDPSRGASKNPAFLRLLHDGFHQALPFLEAASTVIETDELRQNEVVTRLVQAIH